MSIADEIKTVLYGTAESNPIDPQQYFGSREGLRDAPWRPRYLFQVDETIYAIDVFRGRVVPKHIAAQMRLARELTGVIRGAFFVPNGEDYRVVLDICADNGIAIISRLGENFSFLRLDGLPKPMVAAIPATCRLPSSLVGETMSLDNIDSGFADALRLFGAQYLDAAGQGELGAGNEASEQELLSRGFQMLLGADPRFAASYTPLQVLRFFETECRQAVRRDHFFHAFHDFLLGCIVLDDARSTFEDFAANVFGNPKLSAEYVWLLTSLFHDVGYPVEMGADFEALQYGPGAASTDDDADRPSDRVRAQRQDYWDGWLTMRAQLASLWDHIGMAEPRSQWLPEPEPFDGLREHSFDRALYRAFMSRRCHGAASCLRLLAEMHRLLRQENDQQKRAFLSGHIYLAGLSIPFHHDSFRHACRSVGIGSLGTQRFPFASLLMYIDSIQDDRRELDLGAKGPDMLRGLAVDGQTVSAVVDWKTLTPEHRRQVARKMKEVQDVLDFLEQDGLRYRYPPEFLGEVEP